MRIYILFLALVSTSLSANPALYQLDRPADLEDLTVEEVFVRHQIEDFKSVEVSSEVISFPGFCWEFYFIDLVYKGISDGEPWNIRLSLQVFSQENLDRLLPQIEEHIHTKGLPRCLIDNDLFQLRAIDYKKKRLTYHPKESVAGSCGGHMVWQPLTACFDEQSLY